MSFFELLLIAVSLAMDAFSVSICGSLALAPSSRLAGAVKFGAWFGAFQFFMPVIGYWTAYWAVEYIEAYDHWIAFFLLLYIGINMIREAGEDAEVIESYSA
ncbi:MAG: manganese efflux pump, partial [Acidaminococcaceae bacterium]|nr:manganese efflux pump [Acidaminococcaceae bacterium]